MKRTVLTNVTNFILALYTAVWIYYAAFNWEVFSIKLNTNAGFSVIGGYPFVFFFILGLVTLLTIKYLIHLNKVHEDKTEKDSRHRIAIMEKDIELLKMKEVLFKMQTSEMGKNSSHLNALHEKLDNLSNRLELEKEDEEHRKDIEKEDS
ncbi:MAG: hypothetical protein P1P82_05625 [Bacteroidales bacterium]|nr:hypothetical protein [Bacteroidales bacterium]MDT8431387.1 hypothetical protein [Bacteroidales bacterium]